ncbi:unnamed protein product [Amoebophrya sp. A120]|nr:unnamed protein product [Amoebophrya sp. A120]|eukprot:GSA120T00021286001.1
MIESNDCRELQIILATCFIFLLRLKDEALPLRRGLPTDGPSLSLRSAERHSAVFVHSNALHVVLRSRKNRDEGTHLVRPCSCGSVPADLKRLVSWREICPVHVVGAFVRSKKHGEALFPSITYKFILDKMKEAGRAEAAPANFGTQSLRRGAAQSIVACGGNLRDILVAGEWSSKAFREYLDREEIFKAGILEQAKGKARDVLGSSDDDSE